MNSTKTKVLAIIVVSFLSIFAYFQTIPNAPKVNTERLLTTSYTTTATRSTSVNTYCAGKSRNSLIDAEQKSLYKLFDTQMKSSFNVDGNQLFAHVINDNIDQAQTIVKSNITQFSMFIGPFALGLFLTIFISPFLLCCCVCPQSCPTKCCRKNQQQKYTSLQLYWPAVCLALALLLSIGACIAGFSNSQSIGTNIDNNLCSISIILDDLRNGNVTNSGNSFFSGINQIKTQIGYLHGNLTDINNTMATIIPSSTNITTTINRGNTALSDIQKIPNNANSGGNMGNIVYNTPLTSSSPTGTINSIFPNILGSSNTGGIIQSMYKTVETSIALVTEISQSAQHFNNQTSNFDSGVSTMQDLLSQFDTFVIDFDNRIDKLLNNINDKKSMVVLGVKLVYGVTIGIASLMLLGSLMVAFCDKTKCRYLVYFSCFLLFLIGITGFALSLLFSIITPLTFFGCQFINSSLSDATNFNNNFKQTIPNATFRGYMATCLPTQSGDLISAIGGTAVNALLNFSNSVTKMNRYNVSFQSNLLTNGMSSVKTLITNYQQGNIVDFTDASSLTYLKNISNSSSYSSCAATGFSSDSWIPSTNQNPKYINCSVNGNNAVSSSCTSTFTNRGGTCNGCMDTTSVLSGYTTKSSLLTDLDTRYSGCSTFNNDLSNIWQNYYKIKKDSFSPVISRMNTAESSINIYAGTISSTIQPTFANVINSLKAISSTVSDPQYGLVAGLNCKLIGENFQRTFDTFCQSLFTISYFTRIVLGLASFGILFSLCCGICTGVRFMKHQIRKLNSADNAGLDDQAVQDITGNNFVIPKVLQ